MKNTLFLVVCIIMMAVSLQFIPWYWCMLILFLVGFFRDNKKVRNAFILGFLATFITWMSLYLIKDIPNDSLLSTKIAEVFQLGNSYSLFVVSSFIFGLIGGLAFLSGRSMRKAV